MKVDAEQAFGSKASGPLLKAHRLSRAYPRADAPGRRLSAVDDVSFEIGAGETLALVGESGSGKTTIARLVTRLETPDSGTVEFDGVDWLRLSGRELRRKRRDLQIVFQDPQTSLNPKMRIGDQVAEPLRVQRLMPRAAIPGRVHELLSEVGLDPSMAPRFPMELSGGQRQRIAIARALATRPKLLVCDEPVSALDASIAAQIVNLLLELQRTLGLGYLFISHDLAMASRIADAVAVVFAGRIVEEGPFSDVVRRPLHPYTAALVSAVPALAAPRQRIVLLEETRGFAPPAAGCRFASRCPIARPRCLEEVPPLAEIEPGRRAACFYPGELTASV